jgi:hypothetical protein
LQICNISRQYIFDTSNQKRRSSPNNMNNKFLEERFTLVRQRENPPEISSL